MKALGAKREQLAKKDEGFTLIELLVVVIIIGILAAIAIPVYIGVQNSAKESALQSDINNFKTAVVAYFTQEGSYPGAGTHEGTDDAAGDLADQGYPGPSQDYATDPSLVLGDNDTFTICGTALTDGKTYEASESSGVEEVDACTT
jgi:type IV pilus assembly protein PilA